MSKSPPTNPTRPAQRLCLVTPVIEDAAGFAGVLGEALDFADIAAVLLRLKPADERTLINRVKALVPVTQRRDVALVLDGHAEIAIRGGADGAHLTGVAAFSEAVERLGPERIAGCGGLVTRDDAMVAAERGANYVMFGESVDGQRPAFDAVIERLAWWVEVFEVPCVGFATTVDEVKSLAAAGADFVALSDSLWQGRAASAISAAAACLAALEATA